MDNTYVPEDMEFVLDDAVREEFPLALDFKDAQTDEKLNSKRDIMRFIGRSFTATFPDTEYVTRYMDNHEKSELRSEYCQLVENLLPERKRNLEEAIEEAKRIKKEAEELYASTLQEINTMAAEVKLGTKEVKLKGSDTFCIALAGYYLTYTWNEKMNVFVLAKATKVTSASLWSSDDNNRDQLRELFGMEFPETEIEEPTEEEDF